MAIDCFSRYWPWRATGTCNAATRGRWRLGSENIGIVVGLKAEEKIARKLGWTIAIGGGRAAGAAAAVQSLVDRGASALVSFGLAGGIDPILGPGAILVPQAVRLDGQIVACDPVLGARLGGLTDHVLLAGDELLDTADNKRRVWHDLHVHAIDLETGAVARAALAHGLPFAVLRAVCDPANCSLPPAARAALDIDGAIGMWRVLHSVLTNPRQIPDLLALARDAATARRALVRRVDELTRG